MSEEKLAKEIGLRIKEIRGELSQRGFARSLGISNVLVSRYERAENTPHAAILVLIARTYSVSLDWLLLGQGDTRRAG